MLARQLAIGFRIEQRPQALNDQIFLTRQVVKKLAVKIVRRLKNLGAKSAVLPSPQASHHKGTQMLDGRFDRCMLALQIIHRPRQAPLSDEGKERFLLKRIVLTECIQPRKQMAQSLPLVLGTLPVRMRAVCCKRVVLEVAKPHDDAKMLFVQEPT